jgi:SAM-dependent methyltransferase
MPSPRYRPDPVPVTLSDVYAIDFGRRTEDLPLWIALAQRAPTGAPICEVGVGDGRVARALGGPVRQPGHPCSGAETYGIDLDKAFVYRAREHGIEAWHGDAASPAVWRYIPTDCGLVFCAYSTLFLIQHARQADVLRNMAAALRPGGTLAVEVFIPSFDQPVIRETAVGNPNGVGPAWTRQSDFDVTRHPDMLHGITRATRLYGPDRDDRRMELQEIIYWRTPAGLLALFDEAGLPGAHLATFSPALGGIVPTIPLGSVLVTWTRPLEAL